MEIRSELLDVSGPERVLKMFKERFPEFAGKQTMVLGANWSGKLPEGLQTFQGEVEDFYFYTKITGAQNEQPLEILRRILSFHKEIPKWNLHVNFLIERAGCNVIEERADVVGLGFKGEQGFLKCRIRNVDKRDKHAGGDILAKYISCLDLPLMVEKSEQGYKVKELADIGLKVNLTSMGDFNPYSFTCRVQPDMAVLERYLKAILKNISSGKVFGMAWVVRVRELPVAEVTRALRLVAGLPLPEGEIECAIMFPCEKAGDLEVFRPLCRNEMEELIVSHGMKGDIRIRIRRDGYVIHVKGDRDFLLEEKDWLGKLIGRKLKAADFKEES